MNGRTRGVDGERVAEVGVGIAEELDGPAAGVHRDRAGVAEALEALHAQCAAGDRCGGGATGGADCGTERQGAGVGFRKRAGTRRGGVLTVNSLPAVTPMPVEVPVKVKVREVAKVPSIRNSPSVPASVTPFDAFPSAPSAATVEVPSDRSRCRRQPLPKLLVAFAENDFAGADFRKSPRR